MMNFIKNKRSLIIIGLIVIIIIAYGLVNKRPSVEYVTATAERGQVRKTVEATGSVASSQAIELNFKTVGQLQNIYIQEGDQVKAGQKLANLDVSALYSQVKNAQSSLLEAQAGLEKILAGASPEDIQVTQSTVEQRRQAVEAAKNSLTNLKQQAQTELASLKKTAVLTINNQLVVAEAALQEVDRVLNYEDAQDSLSVLNSSALTQAKDSQQSALLALNQFKLSSVDITEQSSDQVILDNLEQLLNLLEKVRLSLSNTFVVLQNTVTSVDLSQSELDSLINSITAQQTNISTANSTVHSSRSNWLNKKVYYQEQISQAEDNLESAQAALAVAQAQLNFKTAKPQSYDIKAAQARVAKAQAALTLAQANLNDAIIYAPVDGTITQINYKIGEQTSLAKPVIEMIGSSPLEIEVDIPESDIAQVKVGQAVEITLDAFGDEQIFDGTITFIDPAATLIQDVVYYKVKVQFNDLDGWEIKPGMTANTTIIIQQKDNVLRVPLRALKNQDEYPYVEILDKTNASKTKKQSVIVGLKGDDYVEIKDGLIEGEEVVTFIKNK